MFKVQFEAGATVLEQGAVPKSTDCLYFLDQGEVDIVIAGSGEAANVAGEERKVGQVLRCWELLCPVSAGYCAVVLRGVSCQGGRQKA